MKKRIICLITVVAILLSFSPIVSADTSLETKLYNLYDARGYQGYTVTVVADQPVYNSRNCIGTDYGVGHTFIRVSKHGTGGWVSYFGWYPDTTLGQKDIILNVSVPGRLAWMDDASHTWDVAKVFEVSEANANKIIDFAQVWEDTAWGSEYNLESNNCTTFAITCLSSIGITSTQHGITQHTWTKPTWLTDQNVIAKILSFHGYTPADAAQDMRAKGGYLVR